MIFKPSHTFNRVNKNMNFHEHLRSTNQFQYTIPGTQGKVKKSMTKLSQYTQDINLKH